MARPKILLQIDSDDQPSVFDAVVAIDAGAEHLLQYGGVTPEQVQDLIHGAMFTRGPADLPSTAAFIGGSDVTAGEAILERIKECFFGPLRVSVMLDASGANTTAVAAVLAAARHVDLSQCEALVLAATGPVGQRAVRLLAGENARVRVASRKRERAAAVCERVAQHYPEAVLQPIATANGEQAAAAAAGVDLVIAAGAAGIQLLPAAGWQSNSPLRVAIDLNAVPPSGVEGVGAQDRAVERDGVICYGALGVGATKMKIHKAAVRKLFEANDQVLDVDEIFALGRELA
jgi:hypothetical protein